MNNELMLDVGQANEFKLACRREGVTNEDIKVICERKGFLTQVRQVMLGLAEIKPVEHTVDLGADPFLPASWKVEEHQKGKVAKLERKGDGLYLEGKKIEFYLPKKQERGCIEDNDLRKELAKMPVLNANVLDYLLKNTRLIPEEWKKDEKGNTPCIFFWGTIYRLSGGHLRVRDLYWHDGGWDWGCGWLDNDWLSRCPAAVSASPAVGGTS